MERATLTVEETAEMLGVSQKMLYEKLIQGQLPVRKLGGKWIISKERILNWLNNPDSEGGK